MDLLAAESYFLETVVKKLHYDRRLPFFRGTHWKELPSNVGARLWFPQGRRGEFYLELNQKYWGTLDEEQQRALLRHEAIHVGHDRHDRMFRLIANSIDAPFTGGDVFGQKYKVYGMDAVGHKTVLGEYDDYDTAREYAKLAMQKARKEGTAFTRIGVTNNNNV